MIGIGAIFDTTKASRSLWIITSLALTLPATTASFAQNIKNVMTAELTPATAVLREADLPRSLSPADIARYHHIFALQQAKDWAAADGEIAQLGDKLLLGALLGQRYRNSSYRASYAELVQWLERYGDQPDAKAIYGLALQRRPTGSHAPPKPLTAPALADAAGDLSLEPRPDLSSKRDRKDLQPAAARKAAALAR